ncbi:MAG: Eco57I restriction-modification methylase domain-containing protein [Myxococcales bacterium]|nr:Eco57I restriction-modification methylase domain-containing protein [Myxococcales bacterium]
MSRPSYQVFTPPDVADRLWDRALEAVGGARTSAPRRLVAVEPAAGDGALIAAGERAVARHGVAVAVEAVELDAMLVAELRRRFPNTNITHADALTLARGAAAPASTPGVAASASSPTQVAGTSSSRLVETAWADLVIANPPYLRETGNRQFFTALRQWAGGAHAPLYRKDTDLHFYFWDIAQRWLAPGGVLAFLTPAYFLEAAAAAPLRAMLETTGELRAVWRAGRAQLFSDAGVEAAVTIWQKAASPRPAHATLSVLPNLQARLEQAHAVDLPDGRVAGDPWWTRSAPTLAALTQEAVELGDMFAIIEGVSTGLNRVRAQHLDLLPGAELGAGVLVLDAAELKRVGVPTSDPRLARRYPESTEGGWSASRTDSSRT